VLARNEKRASLSVASQKLKQVLSGSAPSRWAGMRRAAALATRGLPRLGRAPGGAAAAAGLPGCRLRRPASEPPPPPPFAAAAVFRRPLAAAAAAAGSGLYEVEVDLRTEGLDLAADFGADLAADLEVGEGPAAALRGDCERALHEALRLRLGAATEAEAEGEGEGEAGRTYELSVVVCDDGFIRELNRTWRGVDAATDVLAFPAEAAFPGVPLVPLGDLVVSAETARRQAAAQGGGAGAVPGELR